MSNLPQETRDRIEADAELKYKYDRNASASGYNHKQACKKGYIVGATEWAEKAQGLVDALEMSLKYAEPKGLTHEEYIEAKQKIKELRESLAKYKGGK